MPGTITQNNPLYGCYFWIRDETNRYGARHHRLQLQFHSTAARESSQNSITPFKYRYRDQNDRILLFADCFIPDSEEAHHLLLAELDGRAAAYSSLPEREPKATGSLRDLVVPCYDYPCWPYWDPIEQAYICEAPPCDDGGGSGDGGPWNPGLPGDGSGGGGDGSGGGSSPPPGPEPPDTGIPFPILTDNDFQQDLVTLPDCTETQTVFWRIDYCASQVPTGARLTRTHAALDNIEQEGGVCVNIAQRGRDILSDSQLRYFPRPTNRDPKDIDGGYGSPNVEGTDYGFVLLMDEWVDIWTFNPVLIPDRDGTSVLVNFEFALVHEIEHAMGEPHVGNSRWITPNAKKCSGLD